MTAQKRIEFLGLGNTNPENPIVPNIIQIFSQATPLTGHDAKQMVNDFLKQCHFLTFARKYEKERLVICNRTGAFLADSDVLPISHADAKGTHYHNCSYFIRPNLEYSAEAQYAKYKAGELWEKEVALDACMVRLSLHFDRSVDV
jgi:hypothetical protein